MRNKKNSYSLSQEMFINDTCLLKNILLVFSENQNLLHRKEHRYTHLYSCAVQHGIGSYRVLSMLLVCVSTEQNKALCVCVSVY